MFEDLYTRPGVIRRHREAPLATEREAYLRDSAARGVTRGTLLRQARYVRCVAEELELEAPGRCFTRAEVRILAQSWATRRLPGQPTPKPRGAAENFRSVAEGFLRGLGQLQDEKSGLGLGDLTDKLDEFVCAQRQSDWQAEATCEAGRWQVQRFLVYLKQCRVDLSEVSADHIDAFHKQAALRWNRSSLQRSASTLRRWFTYAAERGWTRPDLAALIETPRIYRDEGLPMGPAWQTVGRMLPAIEADTPGPVRDRAILLLLSVYGLRSGEVRHLRLNDIDWAGDRIRFLRSKTLRAAEAPLQPAVGEAIAAYVSRHRPQIRDRTLFLTLRAPYRKLSTGGLYDVVARHYPANEAPPKGRGPHGLRHACARHLVESGHSFKETGDHLGHRSPASTRVYAKVALPALRLVALEDLGGLA